MKYYKVVSIDPRTFRYYSAIKTELMLEYKVGEWTYPHPHTSLMCFDNLQCATSFLLSGYGNRIFECSIKNPSKKGIFVTSVFDDDFPKMVDQLIKLKKQKKKFFGQRIRLKGSHKGINSGMYMPEGTIFCKAIKLEKQYDI